MFIGGFLPIQPKGFSMTTNLNFKPDHSGMASQASTRSYRGDVSRRLGDIRAVSLEERAINTHHIFSTASVTQELIEETFGKLSHDAQLKADREAYELKDNVLNTFGRIKDSSLNLNSHRTDHKE
jgi:hypothetical protein